MASLYLEAISLGPYRWGPCENLALLVLAPGLCLDSGIAGPQGSILLYSAYLNNHQLYFLFWIHENCMYFGFCEWYHRLVLLVSLTTMSLPIIAPLVVINIGLNGTKC